MIRIVCLFVIYSAFRIPFALVTAQDSLSLVKKLNDTLVLEEHVVSFRSAVTVRKDTVSYAADSFNNDKEADAATLLSKLPGVQISNGQITYQGEPVEKLFINGRELNQSSPAAMLEALPAMVVDRVEFADWKNEEQQFSGVPDMKRSKSLNLRYRPQYKEGLVGKASAGVTPVGRYQSTVYSNLFHGKQTFVFTGSAGNLDGSGRSSGTQIFTDPSGGVSERIRGALTGNLDLGKGGTLAASIESDAGESALRSSFLRSTFLSGDSVRNSVGKSVRQSETKRTNLRLKNNLRFSTGNKLVTTLDITKRSAITRSQLSENNFYAGADDDAFSRERNEEAENNSWSIQGGSNYFHSFKKPGRRLSLRADFSITCSERSLDAMSHSKGSDDSTSGNYAASGYSDYGLNTSGKFNLYEPITKSGVLILSGGLSRISDKADRMMMVSSSMADLLDSIDYVQQDNSRTELKGAVFWQWTGSLVSIRSGLEAVHVSRESSRGIAGESRLKQQGMNYFPSVISQLKTRGNGTIRLNYSGSVTLPSPEDLMPVTDYTDSLAIRSGNPYLRPEIGNTFELAWNKLSGKSKTPLWVSLSGDFQKDKIVQSIYITERKQGSMPVNVDGSFSGRFSGGLSASVLNRKAQLTMSAAVEYGRVISIVNSKRAFIDQYACTPGTRLQWHAGERFEGQLEVTATYADAGQRSGASLTGSASQSGKVSLPGSFAFRYFAAYRSINGYSIKGGEEAVILNMSLEKQFRKIKGLHLAIKVADLLNSQPALSRATTAQYIEDRTVDRISSYWILTMSYNFKKL
ncbi:MAG: TonB-dependent receptor [Chitinophagaceae bacterium]|nr:MAG: TonB-dependent receptor [Chitinophagaceae bacterium]